jgi:hypothetical protein
MAFKTSTVEIGIPLQKLHLVHIGTLTEEYHPCLVLGDEKIEIRWEVDGKVYKIDILRSKVIRFAIRSKPSDCHMTECSHVLPLEARRS